MRRLATLIVLVAVLAAAPRARADEPKIRYVGTGGIGKLYADVDKDPYGRSPTSYGGVYSVLGLHALLPAMMTRYGSILGIHLGGEMRFFGPGTFLRDDEDFGYQRESPPLLFMELGAELGLSIDLHRTERFALGLVIDGIWDMAFLRPGRRSHGRRRPLGRLDRGRLPRAHRVHVGRRRAGGRRAHPRDRR